MVETVKGPQVRLGRPGVHSVLLGCGPKIAVPVWGSTAGEIGSEWRLAATKGADLVEWRVDGVTDPTLETFGLKQRDLYRIPVLVTVRTASQGGRFLLSEDSLPEYRRLVLQGAHWADAVDVEQAIRGAADLAAQAKELGAAVVMSHHVLSGDLSLQRLQDLLQQMVINGADVAKVAWLVQSRQDVAVVEAAQVWAVTGLSVPAVVIGMGPLGSRTRLGESARGSAFTFAVGGNPSAPGQLSVEEVRGSF